MQSPSSPNEGAPPKTPLLSVVIPVYNERFTLRELFRRVSAVDLDLEIILVDDGSTDGTRDIVAALVARDPRSRSLLHERNQGKGAAIRTGLREARGEFVIVQDGDLEYDPAEYPTLLQPLISGQADVVYGSRFLGAPRRVHLFWHMVANRLLTLLTNLTTNLNLTDMETCYKVFRTSIVRRIPLRSNRFGFEPEITAKIARLGCLIYEVPISYSGRSYSEGKKIGLKDAVAAVYTILKYWLISDIGEAGHNTLARMSEKGDYSRVLFRSFESRLGKRVMDVGAGVGNMATFLLDREKLVLAELDPDYLSILDRRFGKFENVDLVSLDLDTFVGSEIARHRLDTVICINVLEHIRDDDRVLREVYDGLPSGGRLVLLVPAHPALYSGLDRGLGHLRRYRRAELEEKLRAAGFELELVRSFNWIGAVGWFVFGRVLRRRHISRVAIRGFRLMSWLRSWEGSEGFRFGLSLMAVARKG